MVSLSLRAARDLHSAIGDFCSSRGITFQRCFPILRRDPLAELSPVGRRETRRAGGQGHRDLLCPVANVQPFNDFILNYEAASKIAGDQPDDQVNARIIKAVEP